MPRRAAGEWVAPLLVCAAGLLAYSNSFAVPFVFDGRQAIEQNPHIRHLWPLWDIGRGTSRPTMYLSLAVNYALGGLAPWGYHAVSLGVHLLAGLVLYGLIRRTLLQAGGHTPAASRWLAAAGSLLWVVHPLQTETVTNVYQRSEALMGLCYLLTLYCTLRSHRSRRSSRWQAGAIISCAVGMASKPVMVTAPLLVLLYDRAFLAGSFRAALRQRRGLYAGLAATWALLGVVLIGAADYGGTGLAAGGMTVAKFVRSQPGVVLHYLRLAVWPHPLALDYAWPVAEGFAGVALPSMVLAAGFWGVWRLWRRRPALGWPGAAFALLLAPTSSVIPIVDLAVEHRMYLPLAPLLTALVLAGDRLIRRAAASQRTRRGAAAIMTVALAAALGTATFLRNRDYRSEEAIWRDTVVKRPQNPRAWYSLGFTLSEQGADEEASGCFRRALALKPDYGRVHNDLAVILIRQGRLEEAWPHVQEALRLLPASEAPYSNAGNLWYKQGRADLAERYYRIALQLNPRAADIHNNLGVVLSEQRKYHGAAAHFREALRLDPANEQARHNLALASRQGREAANGERNGQ